MSFSPDTPLKAPAESGFTLLEIMLVLVILAVSSMMVAPSFFSASSLSMQDEARRLVQVLRLAQEEAALSGQSFRVQFRRHSYAFQSADRSANQSTAQSVFQAEAWQTLDTQPYREHRLAGAIQVLEIRPKRPMNGHENSDEEYEAVLAYLTLSANAVGQLADIVLAEEMPSGGQLIVQFRPGPGGIRIRPETP